MQHGIEGATPGAESHDDGDERTKTHGCGGKRKTHGSGDSDGAGSAISMVALSNAPIAVSGIYGDPDVGVPEAKVEVWDVPDWNGENWNECTAGVWNNPELASDHGCHLGICSANWGGNWNDKQLDGYMLRDSREASVSLYVCKRQRQKKICSNS